MHRCPCQGIRSEFGLRLWASGVISALLANLYLHWFDALFHGANGPARNGEAKLVRYADDMVVLARRWKPELTEYIESRLEGKFQLEINRDKTRIVDLKEERESLDFLGYTFRYDCDLKGRTKKYLNLFPSEKALQKERERLHEMTDSHQCFKPIPRAKAKSSDRRTKPASEGMGQLLFDWISDYGLLAD